MLILPLKSNLLPVVDKAHWEQTNADSGLQRDEKLRCSVDPWYWLSNYVYTIRRDEYIEGSSVERFPPDPYLRYIFHCCFTHAKLAIDKSRQMRMTWVMMAYELWNAQFKSNEMVTCQTKKQPDADEELIKRAHFMWKSQPSWLAPPAKRAFCRLEFPGHNSLILGIPNGGDQIRSHNPSRHLGDECGFLEGEFEECRTAALACCKDIKLISTANAGLWDDFINDSLVAA